MAKKSQKTATLEMTKLNKSKKSAVFRRIFVNYFANNLNKNLKTPPFIMQNAQKNRFNLVLFHENAQIA